MVSPRGPLPETNAALWRKLHGMPSSPTGIGTTGATSGSPLGTAAASSAVSDGRLRSSCTG